MDDWKGEDKLRNIKPDDHRRWPHSRGTDLCQDPDCQKPLSPGNLGGYCQVHRKPPGTRKRS